MNSMRFSSGDLVADRRAEYAAMLHEHGDHAAAAELMHETLLLVPDWAAGWYRLGEMREASGDIEGAAQAWRRSLRIDPADRMGAALKLELIGAASAIDALPSAFVETLFDQYADRFDASLVERLGYRAPELIMAALQEAGAERFAHVVDLGCGTGLMGERLRAVSSFIEGNDISRGMLRKAETKRIYDRLWREDLQTFTPGARRADLAVAADVLIYLGPLDRLFDAVATMTLPGGLFAFSVESHGGPEPMLLRPSRRYAHQRAYIEAQLVRAGFEIEVMRSETLRQDRGEPVEGLIVVARLALKSTVETFAAPFVTDEEQPAALN